MFIVNFSKVCKNKKNDYFFCECPALMYFEHLLLCSNDNNDAMGIVF